MISTEDTRSQDLIVLFDVDGTLTLPRLVCDKNAETVRFDLTVLTKTSLSTYLDGNSGNVRIFESVT